MFFKDLTRIEQKEEQQRLKNRLAELGQMAASLAHDIRNPLASIDVTCSLLKRRLDPEDESRKLLEKINAEVRRLNHTISSSLEFVRPVSLDLARSELSGVLEDAIRVARERRGRPEIEIQLHVPVAIQPFLMDREQLRQVFENLILNALEAIPGQGVVTIEAAVVPAPDVMSVPYEPEGRSVRDPWQSVEELAVVRVSDSGPGISEEERDRIFYPFYTTKKQGSGVGLAMVKKIVGSHRGLIDVDISPRGGARFTVRLPMVQVRPEEEPR
jgi:signal transduction histidine kinase